MTYATRDGDGGCLPSPFRVRPQAPTPDQVRALRNEDWLRAFEVGRPDLDGITRRRSVALLAALYGVDNQTVRDGIARARAVRREIRHAIAS